MTPIERALAEIGVIPKPAPAPPSTRPAGPPVNWAGTWYRDTEVPF